MVPVTTILETRLVNDFSALSVPITDFSDVDETRQIHKLLKVLLKVFEG